MLHEDDEEIVERQLQEIFNKGNKLADLPYYLPKHKFFRIVKEVRGAAVFLTGSLVIVLGCIVVGSFTALVFYHAMRLIYGGF